MIKGLQCVPLIRVSRDQVAQTYSQQTWQRRAYEDFISIILSREYGMKTFPCVYATKGFKSNDHRYVFTESDDPSEPRNVRLLGDALRAYLRQSHSIGPNTSLVIICPPSTKDRSVEDYNLSFWGLLRGLRIYDSKPWPEHVPADTTTSRWAFCFEGVPWFFAVLTPAHSKRQSRYAPNFGIVIQPKWVFDVLFNTPEKRQAACGKVRSLLADFDEIPLSPDIAHHGDPGTTESRQYYLLDENKTSFCPYSDLDR